MHIARTSHESERRRDVVVSGFFVYDGGAFVRNGVKLEGIVYMASPYLSF
jgi:methylaspartate ammonia-lyase